MPAISWEKLEDIYDAYPEFNRVGRKLRQYYYEFAEERGMWINYSAEERYNLLFKEYSKPENQIMDTDLASYLSITQ
ncbi:hypothetical protein [Chitinophaga arvensicola]|uniref:hypothetical protein n=1 Tax=Chitinophaga arvensicola TaxID=29529 RepID=UPI000B7FEEA5|nr:hypothetical protein [Chitinophaga arvensicola]